jgi:hypothetical protein
MAVVMKFKIAFKKLGEPSSALITSISWNTTIIDGKDYRINITTLFNQKMSGYQRLALPILGVACVLCCGFPHRH